MGQCYHHAIHVHVSGQSFNSDLLDENTVNAISIKYVMNG